MSEQFAMQPEEFDSTNERLDSILDRLNALGQSASAMKVAPLDGGASTTTIIEAAPDAGDAITFDEFDAPEFPDEVSPELDEVLETSEPAIIEPPVAETSELAEAEIAELPEVDFDTPVDGEVFAALDPVELNDPIEAVAAAPFDTPVPPAIPDEALAMPEAAVPVPPAIPTNAPFDHAAFEETELDDPAVAETALEESAFEDTIEFEPLVAPTLAPNLETPAIETPPPIPEIALAIEAPAIEDPAIENAAFDETVFEAIASPGSTPDAPTSIFGSTLGRSGAPHSDAPAAPAEPVAEETDGWVSYHDVTPDAPEAEQLSTPPSDLASTEAMPTGSEGYDVNSDPQWEIDSPLEGSIFDQGAQELPTRPDPVEMATEVEQTLGELNPLDQVEPFDQVASTDAPIAIAGVDTAPEVEFGSEVNDAPVAGDADLYATDDELPLPDFTGVYVESPEEAKKGLGSGGAKAIQAGRDELDKLRPTDEEAMTAQVEAEAKNLTINKQFLLVLAFGIGVLVFFLITQDGAIEDIRSSLDGLLGN